MLLIQPLWEASNYIASSDTNTYIVTCQCSRMFHASIFSDVIKNENDGIFITSHAARYNGKSGKKHELYYAKVLCSSNSIASNSTGCFFGFRCSPSVTLCLLYRSFVSLLFKTHSKYIIIIMMMEIFWEPPKGKSRNDEWAQNEKNSMHWEKIAEVVRREKKKEKEGNWWFGASWGIWRKP